MKASIITPTFNSLAHVDACITNVAEQGDAVLEHIVVDGDSTDGTAERVLELGRKNSRIKLIPGPDKGQSDALNKASHAAQGDVIGILNADDFYERDAVRRGIEALSSFKTPGLVVGDCRVLEADGSSWWNRPADLRLEALLLGWRYAPHPVNPSAYFYHRVVHEIVGDFNIDEHFAMDVEFILRCAERVSTRYVGVHWGNFVLAPGTKTFEDQHGPERVAAIVRGFRARLGLAQCANMARIKAVKDGRLAIRRLRHALVGKSQ